MCLRANIHAVLSLVGWVTCDPRVAMMELLRPRGFKNPPYKADPIYSEPQIISWDIETIYGHKI